MVENRKRSSSTKPTESASNKRSKILTKSLNSNETSANVEPIVDTYECLYTDPLMTGMGAHEKFVFNLGLDLALEYSLESFNSMINAKLDASTYLVHNNKESSNESASLSSFSSTSSLKSIKLSSTIVDSLPFEVDNKYEFFTNLNKNRKIIRKRTRSFHFALKECTMCSFKTDSKLVMDSHLSEPHNMSTLRYAENISFVKYLVFFFV